MEKFTSRRDVNKLTLLFSITYMISYITRINYGAIVAKMEIATSIPRSLLSLALTGSFITYGVGQIISGICGDKFSPKKLVTLGLIVTVAMNLLIPICSNPYQMLGVWCVNGFAQAFMWPPLVKLMTSLLSEDDYKKSSAKISWGSSFGTIAVYLFSPLLISLFGWKSVFLFSAVFGTAMIFVWNKYSYEIPKPTKKAEKTSSSSSTARFISPLMLCVMLCIVLQGMLRDGVTTWTPSYISETYNLDSVISILTNVVMPIFGILCFCAATNLYIKKFTNPLTCAGVFFGVGAVASLGLVVLSGTNAVFSVVFSAVLTGCMHGVNLILICMIPLFFKKHGNVSTVSGTLNFCTYIGSAISTYGVATLSENAGWRTTLVIWFAIAALGTLLCFVCAAPWRKTHMSYNK